uniref:Uncharacterized protein n=1 Tax=Cacopsylla melanoneura TaxID=428564 RepID=A0A8D8R935_9HEMI
MLFFSPCIFIVIIIIPIVKNHKLHLIETERKSAPVSAVEIIQGTVVFLLLKIRINKTVQYKYKTNTSQKKCSKMIFFRLPTVLRPYYGRVLRSNIQGIVSRK